MKYLLFIVLLVAVVIAAGCVGGNNETVVASTAIPTTQAQDPIIGSWRYLWENSTSSVPDYDERIVFSYDGTFARSFFNSSNKETDLYYGTWGAQGSNKYTLHYTVHPHKDTVIETYIYDPAKNAIYESLHNDLLFTPYLGDVAKDPIIGVWRLYMSSMDIDDRYRFNADGTYVESYYYAALKITPQHHGTWEVQGSNSYVVINTADGGTATFIYDPVRNIIYDSRYAAFVYYPYNGDVAVASLSPASTPTYSSQPSSSGSTHFSGSGDDVRSFTATGAGLRIFTMSHTGSHNFAVVLKDNGGNYITLLANEIGSYSGKKSERLTSGTYYLDITADGSWTIDISSM